MLRQRRPPVLCGTGEAPITATLLGFRKQSSGCLTRSGSPALEPRGPLLGEGPGALPGVLGLVDQGGDRRVVSQRLVRVLVEPTPRQLLRDLDRQRPVLADTLGVLRRRPRQRVGR